MNCKRCGRLVDPSLHGALNLNFIARGELVEVPLSIHAELCWECLLMFGVTLAGLLNPKEAKACNAPDAQPT
jgi:hypothetical protein